MFSYFLNITEILKSRVRYFYKLCPIVFLKLLNYIQSYVYKYVKENTNIRLKNYLEKKWRQILCNFKIVLIFFIYLFLLELNSLHNIQYNKLKWYFGKFGLESWKEKPQTNDARGVWLYG